MDEQLKENIKSRSQWLRLLFMILIWLLIQVGELVMGVVVVLQFIFALITGKDNDNLRSFGQSLATYIFQGYQYLTYNSEDKPFPFKDWPEPGATVSAGGKATNKRAVSKRVTRKKAPAKKAPPKSSGGADDSDNSPTG